MIIGFKEQEPILTSLNRNEFNIRLQQSRENPRATNRAQSSLETGNVSVKSETMVFVEEGEGEGEGEGEEEKKKKLKEKDLCYSASSLFQLNSSVFT